MIARNLSIIVAQRDLLLRADVRSGSVAALHRLDPQRDAALADRVDAAARSSGRLASRTLLLTDDAFCQTLELDARALRGLSDDDVGSALALEAQLFSGLAASEALIAWRRLEPTPGARRFLVTEFGRAELAEIGARLSELGSRLAGAAHPAGVPQALSASAVGGNGTLLRFERWPDVTALVARRNDGDLEVDVRRSEHGANGALPVGAAPLEMLAAPALALPSGGPGGHHCDLAGEDALRRWLEAWADSFISGRALTLGLEREPASPARRVLFAVALALAVVALCGLDRRGILREQARSGQLLAAARGPIDRLMRTRSEAASLAAELRELREGRAVSSFVAGSAWNSRMPEQLLAALAQARPEGVVLGEVSIGSAGGSVAGFAARYEAVDELLTRLDAILRPSGILMHPQSRRLVQAGENAGLYEFTLAADIAAELGSGQSAAQRASASGEPE